MISVSPDCSVFGWGGGAHTQTSCDAHDHPDPLEGVEEQLCGVHFLLLPLWELRGLN